MSRKAEYTGLPECITQYAAHIAEITEYGAITTDGKEITDIETIIFCTGYNMKVGPHSRAYNEHRNCSSLSYPRK